MPVWSKVAAGLVLAGVLIGLVGFRAYSERLGPYVGQYGTTYYNGEGPLSVPVTCKPESEIRAAIVQVHAKFDYLEGDALRAFERRAADLKGLPPLNIDHYTAFVAVTHDPKIDDPALLHAFARNCFYIGALGSRKTHAKRAERLKAQGATDADIARIRAPIGLSIGAVSPSEIAVAIMAEITAELRLPKETAKVQAA